MTEAPTPTDSPSPAAAQGAQGQWAPPIVKQALELLECARSARAAGDYEAGANYLERLRALVDQTERHQGEQLARVSQLSAAFENFWKRKVLGATASALYGIACREAQTLEFSPADLLEFSTTLTANYADDRAGFFLSACANKIADPQTEVVLDVTAVGSKARLDYLGYQWKKGTLRIIGSGGDRVGESMSAGQLLVEGNTRDYVAAKMTGGELTVTGDVGHYAGFYNAGGTVRIQGNALTKAGHMMRDGELHIEGKLKGLGNRMSGGLITEGGRQLWPRG